MKQPATSAPRKKDRLTAIKRAAEELNVSQYKILQMISIGELEAEPVDGKPKVKTESLDRYQAASA
jgi:hypothetical protein